ALGSVEFYWGVFDELENKSMLSLADSIRNKRDKAVVFIVSKRGEKLAGLLALSRELSQRLSAVELFRLVASKLGGGGGGRQDLAQGGLQSLEPLEEALKELKDAIIKSLEVEG
ncbi:MAG: alanine--tRNA ligase, partial [Aquificota bacterium]